MKLHTLGIDIDVFFLFVCLSKTKKNKSHCFCAYISSHFKSIKQTQHVKCSSEPTRTTTFKFYFNLAVGLKLSSGLAFEQYSFFFFLLYFSLSDLSIWLIELVFIQKRKNKITLRFSFGH